MTVALALWAMSASVYAQAQSPSAPAADSWASVETVEVKAAPGPAVWHLTRGNSEVWLLGVVYPMPKDLDWNKKYLADLLDGAHAILMPPRPSVGLIDGAWFMLTNGGKLSLPSGEKLEAILPEAMRARFVAARTAIGKDARRYETDTPVRAALRLQTDFHDTAGLNGWEPNATITSLAEARHVPAKPVSRYEILDIAREVLRLDLPQQEKCLNEAVEDVDRQAAHAGVAARAWAVGDLKTVKANYTDSRFNDCVIAAVQHYADIDARNIADNVAAIDAALNVPGKTIAVVNIGPLLRRGGVLQQLKARDIAIEGPPDSP